MKLAYWMYAGPAHIGTLRVASSFKNVHAIMHAPLGDDYFNVLRSMLERSRDFTPVTTSIVDRHVLAKGSQVKVVENTIKKAKADFPDLVLLTPTCTSSILQEDLTNFVEQAKNTISTDVLLADVNHYRVNEFQAADRTLEQIIKYYLEKEQKKNTLQTKKTETPSVNLFGFCTLGFHTNHDFRELKRILNDLDIKILNVFPENATVHNIKSIPSAWFNIIPYREQGLLCGEYLKQHFNMPYVSRTPMGALETSKWIQDIKKIITTQTNNITAKSLALKNWEKNKKDYSLYIEEQTRFFSQSSWFSKSIDCQNLTGKKVVVFGDVTHAVAMTKILVKEMGVFVVCAGTYCKHDGDWFREQLQGYCREFIITDDFNEVNKIIAHYEPAAIFGTQMERHSGKKLGIPCGVISAPVHIQNFPLGYRPFFGYEGANQIADLIYNSFTLGMEDHLLEIFGGHDTSFSNSNKLDTPTIDSSLTWDKESLAELQNIPGFVRGKVKRRVEKFALQENVTLITREILYAAKNSA
uniref:Light-independent protochlorophyllide reductase subunit B n=1 Tax=Prasinococcus sp. CCMP1194 TaxID=110672 RepID=A0A088CJP3_9VIRI|nr:ChlB subunit of protochlorophyllide reductase [Prasinococcus sp. CCMP1194]